MEQCILDESDDLCGPSATWHGRVQSIHFNKKCRPSNETDVENYKHYQSLTTALGTYEINFVNMVHNNESYWGGYLPDITDLEIVDRPGSVCYILSS